MFFFHRLPFSVWECKGLGCATRLRVETGTGVGIFHAERFGKDMPVCTADYVETVGRVHCRDRRIEDQILDRENTTFIGNLPEASSEGDWFSRLTTGSHSWVQGTDPWHPAEDGIGAEWSEASWTGEPVVETLQNAHNNVIVEGIVGGLAELFRIGDRKTHPMSVRFCGELGAVRGAPTFTLDESSVVVEMEPYSRFKPSCNRKFVPLVKQGRAAGVSELTDAVTTEELGDSDFDHVPRASTHFSVPKRGMFR